PSWLGPGTQILPNHVSLPTGPQAASDDVSSFPPWPPAGDRVLRAALRSGNAAQAPRQRYACGLPSRQRPPSGVWSRNTPWIATHSRLAPDDAISHQIPRLRAWIQPCCRGAAIGARAFGG